MAVVNRFRATPLLGIIGIGICMLLACGKEKEKEIADVDPEGGEEAPNTARLSPESTVPDEFPEDIPVAEFLVCKNISEVNNTLLVNFRVKEKSVEQLVAHFKAELIANGWTSNPGLERPNSAILSFKKGGRSCGITISGFVLGSSGERDETTRGVSIQTPRKL